MKYSVNIIRMSIITAGLVSKTENNREKGTPQSYKDIIIM